MSFNFSVHEDSDRRLSCSWCNTGQYCYVKGSPFKDEDGMYFGLIPSEVQLILDMIRGSTEELDWPNRVEPSLFGSRKCPMKVGIDREAKELIFASTYTHGTGRYPIDYFVTATNEITRYCEEHFPDGNVVRPAGGMFPGSFVTEPAPKIDPELL